MQGPANFSSLPAVSPAEPLPISPLALVGPFLPLLMLAVALGLRRLWLRCVHSRRLAGRMSLFLSWLPVCFFAGAKSFQIVPNFLEAFVWVRS
jgi:hypothetical protein